MAGGVITTGAHPKALWPGVKAWWGNVYDEFQTEYQDLVDTVSSDKAYEDIVQDTGFSLGSVKPQGQALLTMLTCRLHLPRGARDVCSWLHCHDGRAAR